MTTWRWPFTGAGVLLLRPRRSPSLPLGLSPVWRVERHRLAITSTPPRRSQFWAEFKRLAPDGRPGHAWELPDQFAEDLRSVENRSYPAHLEGWRASSVIFCRRMEKEPIASSWPRMPTIQLVS